MVASLISISIECIPLHENTTKLVLLTDFSPIRWYAMVRSSDIWRREVLMTKLEEYTFLADLVACDTLDKIRAPLVGYLERRFDAQTVTILQFWKDAAPDFLISHIPDAELRTFYLTTYAKIGYILDPFFISAFGNEEYAACKLRDVAPDRFETSEYFHQYYAETGLVDELGAIIRVSQNVVLHLSLGRKRERGRFRAQEQQYFELLAPVVMRKLKALKKSAPGPREMRSGPDLAERYQHLSRHAERPLSRREAEIAALIVQGHSSRAVGLRLKISDQTVKVHRRNIYKKLKISSQNELFSLLINEL